MDPAHHILGERLNFWVASLLTLAGIAWFRYTRRAGAGASQPSAAARSSPGTALVSPLDHYPGSGAKWARISGCN